MQFQNIHGLFRNYDSASPSLGTQRQLLTINSHQPQRLRVFQVGSNDENVPPSLLQAAQVREKSTTIAPMVMATIGGLKVPAKRAAFADVSNTTNMAQKTAHDGCKKANTSEAMIKDAVSGAQEAFHRPAQRPLKHASSVIGYQTKAVAPINDLYVNPDSKTTVGKKTGFVYNDNDWQHQNKANATQPASTAQTRQVRQYKSQPQLKPEMPILRRTQSKQFSNSNAHAGDAVRPLEDLTEARYEDAVEHLVHMDEYQDQAQARDSSLRDGALLPSTSGPDNEAAVEGAEEKMAAIMSEPDEYWEEEEDEIYDDGGYTTAHSFRFRGDFTTGGVTTVLYPKVTSKVLRELEAAKAFVEATRTDYEIEEDIWDVSMVAEYGEDIFEYMRVLEVSSSTLMRLPMTMVLTLAIGPPSAKPALHG
jgi:hypothetical protein